MTTLVSKNRTSGPAERAPAGSALARTPVADAMNPAVISCGPETPLDEVAQMMVAARIHSVIVVQLDAEGATGWGVVSDLDVVEAGDRAVAMTAGEAAATELVAIAAGETLERAAQIMTEHEIAHIVVLDDRLQEPVGVLSSLDVARVVARPGDEPVSSRAARCCTPE